MREEERKEEWVRGIGMSENVTVGWVRDEKDKGEKSVTETDEESKVKSRERDRDHKHRHVNNEKHSEKVASPAGYI